jgi:pimeloyl-ACP methyl ester carboxylesterase
LTYAQPIRLAIIGALGAALVATGIMAAAPSATASLTKGSFYKAQVAAERKKCKKVKAKAKKRKCLKTAKKRAAAKTNQAMKGTNRLYGFGLKAKQIPARNGALIWSKRLPATEGAARTDFVLYSSKSFPGNRKITVSGTVSVPDSPAPQGGYPVISWAHGTTGLADQCAPSRGGDQGSYGGAEPLIEHWLDQGYAVVATDYEGLGTPGVHPYLIGQSEGRGVLDIVRAGRTLDRRLSNEVVIAGHSQGGHAALFAAGLAPTWGAGIGHLGTIPYAPPANLPLQAQGIGALPADAYGISALAAAILRGAVVRDPSIDPEDLLTPEALELYPQAASLCLGELGEEFAAQGVGPGDLLAGPWQSTDSGQAFIQVLVEAEPLVQTNRPMLILQGLQDTTVQPGLTNTLVSQLRNENDPGLIEYYTYGNAGGPDFPTVGPSDHSGILADSIVEVDGFLEARFLPSR